MRVFTKCFGMAGFLWTAIATEKFAAWNRIATETRNMHWAEHLRGLTEGCDATWHLVCCIQTCIYPHFFCELWGKCPCSCLGAYCQFPFHTSHDLKGHTPVPIRVHSEGQNCRPTSNLWQIVDVLGRTNNQNHKFKHYMLRVAGHFWAGQKPKPPIQTLHVESCWAFLVGALSKTVSFNNYIKINM